MNEHELSEQEEDGAGRLVTAVGVGKLLVLEPGFTSYGSRLFHGSRRGN
jgi:hypothetical protein